MEWLFQKSGNIEFAEDPETPYAVNTTNPKAMAYLEKFNAEADALFDAPGFHAGLDEVTMRGRFPYRSLPRTFPDLFVENAKVLARLRDEAGENALAVGGHGAVQRGCRPELRHRAVLERCRRDTRRLPKDIVMVDWQYSPRPSYPSLKALKDAGFQEDRRRHLVLPEGSRISARQ
jgi:hypothetical protein